MAILILWGILLGAIKVLGLHVTIGEALGLLLWVLILVWLAKKILRWGMIGWFIVVFIFFTPIVLFL